MARQQPQRIDHRTSGTAARARKKPSPTTTRYRLAVVSRVMAALAGGYFCAYACAALLVVILPFDRINRVVTAELLSFVVWCLAAIGVFSARNAWRGWWPVMALGALAMSIALAFRVAGMRP